MSSIDSWRRSQQRRRRGATLAVVLAVVVAVLAGFMYWNHGSSYKQRGTAKTAVMRNRAIGAGVSVTGEKVPSDMHAQIAKHPIEPQIGLTTALTKTLEIGPSGTLAAPATITMTLDRPVEANDTVVIATNPTHTKDGWQTVSAKLSSDRRHVTFTVDHLSWFKALLVDVKGAVGQLKKEFVDGMTAGIFAQAEKPTCSNESGAKQDDYNISSSTKDTLYWCFGIENGKRTVKVVNRRSYPLEITTSNLSVVSSGHGSLDLAGLARLGHHTIVMPGEEAVMTVSSLKADQKATIDSNLSNLAMGLHTVDVIGTAVAQLTLKVDPNALKNTRELVNDVLSLKSCIDVLGDMNVGHFLSGCFDAHTLSKFLNWRAAILTPVVTAFSAIGLTHSWLNLVGDSRNGRAKYGITINKAPKPQAPEVSFQDYVGIWSAAQIGTDIKASGNGTLSWSYGNGEDNEASFVLHRTHRWEFSQPSPRAIAAIARPTASSAIPPVRKYPFGSLPALEASASVPSSSTPLRIPSCSVARKIRRGVGVSSRYNKSGA